MTKKTLPLLLLLVFTSIFAQDREQYNELKVDDFSGPVEADPLIKDFQVKVKQMEAFFDFNKGIPYYFSDMIAKIEVHNPKNLGQYGIVQYIRGCHYNTELKDGKIHYSLATSRKLFEKYITFIHPEWVVDSTDTDPIYWSGVEAEDGKNYGRTGLYRLDNPQESNSRKQYKFFFRDNKNHTKYYISDHPSGASQSSFDNSFSNVSLQFRTCLFKNDQVPQVSDPYGQAIKAGPLKCYDWQSNFQYDFESNQYEMRDQINPFCQNQMVD